MRDRIAQFASSIKSSVGGFFSDVAAVGGYLGGMTRGALGNAEWQREMRESTLQAVEGLSPTAMTSLPKAALRYPESRHAISSTLWTGAVFYAVPAVAYRLGVRPVLMHAVEGTYAQYPFYIADAAANAYLVRAGLNFSIDTLFYGLGIAKTTTPKPEELKHDHDSLVPCPEKCGALVNQQASFMAQLNGMAALKTVRLVDYAVSTVFLSFEQPVVPILGAMVSYPFLRLIEGRLLVSYKLAAVGMCAEHREDILSANNGYCLGKGISYDLTLRILNNLAIMSAQSLVWYLTGLDISAKDNSFFYAAARYIGVDKLLGYAGIYYPGEKDLFVDNALSYLVWLSFSVAETQVNNVLPGKVRGREIFYLPNLAVKTGLTFLIDRLTEAFKPKPGAVVESPTAEVDFTWAAPIVRFYQAAPIQMFLTFINSDLLSLDKFLKRRSVDVFSNAYSQLLHDNIDWFKGLRKGRVPRFVLEKLVPESYVSSSSKAIVLTLRKKRWDAPVAYIDQVIHRICPTEFSHLQHVASMPALLEAEKAAAKEKEKLSDPDVASPLVLARQSASVASSRSEIFPPRIPLQKSMPLVKTVIPREENTRMSEAARLMLGKKKED